MIVKDFGLNLPQAKALLVNANKNWILWARGTGKTTGVLGPKSWDLVHKMPRAKGGLIGKDYEQIFDRTLPEIVSVWEQLGYIENKHWRIGKPLDGWEKPIIPPMKWDNVISWYNGAAIHLLSLAVRGCANGLSLQWLIGDEAKFFKQRLLKEILKAVRGLRKEFGHLPEYQSYWFATDKWTDDLSEIQWILDYKKKVNHDAVEVALDLQLEINRLRDGYEKKTDNEQKDVEKKVSEIENVLTPLRKTMINVTEASSIDNLEVLGQEYLDSQRQDLGEDEYDIAIDNKDPKRSRRGFYPGLNDDVHFYEMDNDIQYDLPLIIAADYQASISPICITQFAKLPGQMMESLNFNRQVYEEQPKGLEEACNSFIKLMHRHLDKTVYFVHDSTAIGKNPFGKTYAQLVTDTLAAGGWSVIPVYTFKPPRHGVKFEQIKKLHKNTDPIQSPLIRFNKRYNDCLITSMDRALAITTAGETKKDKHLEDTNRYPDYPQRYATHFSDVHDQIVWATHVLKLVPIGHKGSWVGAIR